MEYLWLYIIVGFIIIVAVLLPTSKKVVNESAKRKEYDYARRDYIMTQAEMNLFRRLEKVAADRYYIFPQVHLSSLLNHTVKGQNWKAALSAIQRKSVDFALVDKVTLKTTYAVELDDSTHDRPDRQERDGRVEQYLQDAGIPLVRLRNVDKLSDIEIENCFRLANEQPSGQVVGR